MLPLDRVSADNQTFLQEQACPLSRRPADCLQVATTSRLVPQRTTSGDLTLFTPLTTLLRSDSVCAVLQGAAALVASKEALVGAVLLAFVTLLLSTTIRLKYI